MGTLCELGNGNPSSQTIDLCHSNMPSQNGITNDDLAYEDNRNEHRLQHRLQENGAASRPLYHHPIAQPMYPLDRPKKKIKVNHHGDAMSERHLQLGRSSNYSHSPEKIPSSPSLTASSTSRARPASSTKNSTHADRTHSSLENPYSTSRGLRHFSMKVCEKVEEKGTTTYNEVADEVRVVRFFFYLDLTRGVLLS